MAARGPRLPITPADFDLIAGNVLAGRTTIAAEAEKRGIKLTALKKKYSRWLADKVGAPDDKPAAAGTAAMGAKPAEEAGKAAPRATGGAAYNAAAKAAGIGGAETAAEAVEKANAYSRQQDEEFVLGVASMCKSAACSGLAYALWHVNLQDPRVATVLKLLPMTEQLLRAAAPELAPKLRALLSSWWMGVIVLGYDALLTSAAMYGLAKQQAAEERARREAAEKARREAEGGAK